MKLETSASQKKNETDCSNFIHGSITGSPLIFEAFRRVYLGEREESDITPETFQKCALLLMENVVNDYMEIGPQRVKNVAEENQSELLTKAYNWYSFLGSPTENSKITLGCGPTGVA